MCIHGANEAKKGSIMCNIFNQYWAPRLSNSLHDWSQRYISGSTKYPPSISRTYTFCLATNEVVLLTQGVLSHEDNLQLFGQQSQRGILSKSDSWDRSWNSTPVFSNNMLNFWHVVKKTTKKKKKVTLVTNMMVGFVLEIGKLLSSELGRIYLHY